MSLVEWAGVLSGFAAFGAAIIAATSWVLKSYLKNFVHELKPNGGGSMKDTVNQIHSEITELRISVAKLEGQFTQHLAEIGKNEQYSYTPTITRGKGSKMNKEQLVAAAGSYIRAAIASVVALAMAGQTDPSVLANAFIAGLVGPLAKALNPKDKAYGIGASK